MAQSIGQVTRKGSHYRGFVRTALVKGALEIIPNGEKIEGTRQPDYRLIFEGQEAGGGWYAEAKAEMDYRSINCQIDDPSFPAPLRFSLGRAPGQDDDDLFNLIWNRPAETARA